MLPQHRGIKFNDNETSRFLQLYSMEKVLYDPTSDDYRDRDLRAAAANRISRELNIPGLGPKEVIAKFKNLRSSYCQELKKISDNERSGSGTDDIIYKPKVFWFAQMNSFIRPFVQQRPTKSNLVFPKENSQKQTEQKQSEPEIECHSASKHSEESSPDTSEKTWEVDPPRKKGKRKLYKPLAIISKNKKTTHDDEISYMSNATDNLQEVSNRASQVTANKDDIFYYFGKYVAYMLRSLGQPAAIKLQQDITNMIALAICPPENPTSDNSMLTTCRRHSSPSAYSASNVMSVGRRKVSDLNNTEDNYNMTLNDTSNTDETVKESTEHITISNNITQKKKLVFEDLLGKACSVLSERGDDLDVFGKFVSSELRGLKNDILLKKSKRQIQRILLDITEEDDANTPTTSFIPITRSSPEFSLLNHEFK